VAVLGITWLLDLPLGEASVGELSFRLPDPMSPQIRWLSGGLGGLAALKGIGFRGPFLITGASLDNK